MRFKFFISLLFGVLAINLFYGACTKSLTTDEPFHLAAGLSYLKTSKFSINPEHPPLIKLLAATIPYFSKKTIPPEGDIKSYFDLIMFIVRSIRLNCAYIDFLTITARIFPILITMFLGFLIYKMGKELYGEIGGLSSLFLFCFEPTFLAHGRLLHTDVAASFFYLLYFYALYKVYLRPSLFYFFLLSTVLGLSLITKFSMLILVPIHFLIMIFMPFKREWRKFWPALPLMIFIPWLIVCAGYFFKISRVSGEELGLIARWLSLPDNVLQFIRYVPIYLPPDFIRGIDAVWEHNHVGHWAYLLGRYSKMGWWYYFPLALCLKESIPILICFFSGLIYCLLNLRRDKKGLFIILPILYYSIFAFSSRINIGIRHYLPVFPFLIIGSGGLCSFLIQKKSYWQIFIVLILIWSALETARAFPDYISYFNPIAGGYKKGWKRLSDSNAEWGQDIKILAKFCKKNHINEIEAYCFNCWLLPCYGIKFRFFSPLREIYLKKWGKETVSFIEGHSPSEGKASPYLAIGSSFLIAPPQAVMPEIKASEAQIIKKKLLLFQKRRPEAVIGKTIFLFKRE